MPHDTKMFKNSHPKAPAPTTNTFSSSNSFCRYIPKIEIWASYPSAWYALVYTTQSTFWDPSVGRILILWAELESILHHSEIKEIRAIILLLTVTHMSVLTSALHIISRSHRAANPWSISRFDASCKSEIIYFILLI